MKSKATSCCLLIFFLFIFCPHRTFAEITQYPAINELKTSPVYEVSVNGKSVWTEQFVSDMDISKLPDWFIEPYVREPQEVNLASFSGSGKMDISVKVARPFTNVTIRPLSKKIEPKVDGNRIGFSIDHPQHLVVEVEGHAPLYLFANPVEESKPGKDDPKVHYFGPGVHHTGYINLKNDETVYISAGAIVYGGIRANGVSNIKIVGEGILDGNFELRRMVEIENCQDVLVKGLTIRNGISWTNTIINCRNVVYDNVKVLSFGPAGDGINPLGSQNVKITNCFLRCTDDCIAIKSPDPKRNVKNISITNNIMTGFAYSDGVTIGFETNGPTVSNVTVKNCDILLARGGSRVDGHSGFSVVCDGPAKISNILFEDIRVEKAENKLFELIITDGKAYGEEPPGQIDGVVLRNINWYHEGPIKLTGFGPENLVQNVSFVDCMVARKPLKEVASKLVIQNKFVNNVKITN